jgi:hypothetical protein
VRATRRRFLADVPFGRNQIIPFSTNAVEANPVDDWSPDKEERNPDPQHMCSKQEVCRPTFLAQHKVDKNDTPELEPQHHTGES